MSPPVTLRFAPIYKQEKKSNITSIKISPFKCQPKIEIKRKDGRILSNNKLRPHRELNTDLTSP